MPQTLSAYADPQNRNRITSQIRQSVTSLIPRIRELETELGDYTLRQRANFLIVETLPLSADLLPKSVDSLVFVNSEGCFYGYDALTDTYVKVGTCCTGGGATEVVCEYLGEARGTQVFVYVETVDPSTVGLIHVTQAFNYIETEFELANIRLTQIFDYIETGSEAAILLTRLMNYVETTQRAEAVVTRLMNYMETQQQGVAFATKLMRYIETQQQGVAFGTKLMRYIETTQRAEVVATKLFKYIETSEP